MVVATSLPPMPLLFARRIRAEDADWVASRLGQAEVVLPEDGERVLLTGLDAAAAEVLRAEGLGLGASGGDAVVLTEPAAALRDWAEQRPSSNPALGAVADVLKRAFAASRPPRLELAQGALVFDARPRLMGVVNVTPDSFSDGGRYLEPEKAVAHALQLVRDGAELLDLGGASTRPGAPEVSVDEELSRVLPVIERLRARVEVPLSIDTTKAAVAEAALAAGASLVNDVSGFLFDPAIASVTARARAAACLQHIQGTPRSMQQDPRYGDVGVEVVAGLGDAISRAQAAGVAPGRLLVDPGIGFGKTVGHNLFLLRRLEDLRQLGCPILVGTSRKAFLGHLTGGRPAGERGAATLGSMVALAVRGAVDVVRVHDVREARDALTVAAAITGAREGGDRFLR